ncbi:type I polyketide synthase [Pseudoalteromonas umbrosa]|uniref:type I polyketide synthase n=1 Tax=Pseudoalteromonas umbrosa TaxID=3048489 RepID=UPI0024C441C9|nr:type I polyketide synthase [Pseudoalteromonas sp. B95]MDK1288847.1 SDR family NAD(P)-dependent oxidoreductase [Pseudoalteromonas sp. B95]
MTKQAYPDNGLEVAVIGMSVRVPGADTLEAFWNNLRNGVESTTFFTQEELIEAGLNEAVITDPHYVPAKGVISDAMAFEPSLFGFSHREAELMDPQLRVYLECVYNGLINAGYQAHDSEVQIGIYGGAGSNPYWSSQFMMTQNDSLAVSYEASNLNGQEFFNTRVANIMDLKGPAVTVQTACSSSLVAVHMAMQALIAGDCEMAIAGGVEMSTNPFQSQPDKTGYKYQEGMIYSKDGKCSPFDAAAGGTVPADGAGVVVLKRLEDAIADGDTVYAVIKGSAINNDGSDKVGFTAPSVEGQRRVIETALEMAEIEPETVSYIEAHGTGTKLGDPIEFRALNECYNAHSRSACGIGSLKSNFGHLGSAAGVAGLIKTVLSIYHNELAPSLNYKTPNPALNIDETPFFVVPQASAWPQSDLPLRAGVSSFGIGGTNAHVLVEEYTPSQPKTDSSDTGNMVAFSAASSGSLKGNLRAMSAHLKREPNLSLNDIAFTLQQGRSHLGHRKAFYCESTAELTNAIEAYLNQEVETSAFKKRLPIFLFPGQGAQYTDMGKALYQSHSDFAKHVDELFDYLPAETSSMLHQAWVDEELINQTQYAQPLLFIVSYALAQVLRKVGVEPAGMIGHSLGEFVAATLAEVFTPQDALNLICLRGKLMAQTAPGAMIAVGLTEQELASRLPTELSIAAINSKSSSVISGPLAQIEQFEADCAAEEIFVKRLSVSHAFHSQTMAPILAEFEVAVNAAAPQAPKMRFVSNVTGKWITDEQAVDAKYWVAHLRSTVRFSDGVELIGKSEEATFIEVGPAQVLTRLVQQHKRDIQPFGTITLLKAEDAASHSSFYNGLCEVYKAGHTLNWQALTDVQGSRIPLPDYVFNRAEFTPKPKGAMAISSLEQLDDESVKFYTPNWIKTGWRQPVSAQFSKWFNERKTWLVFDNTSEESTQLISRLQAHGQDVIRITVGEAYSRVDSGHYQVSSGRFDDYKVLFKELVQLQQEPDYILHLWGLDDQITDLSNELNNLNSTFYSLSFIAQAMGHLSIKKAMRLIVSARGCSDVTGMDVTHPHKATMAGAVRVIHHEYPHIETQLIDFPVSETPLSVLDGQIFSEVFNLDFQQWVAFRGNAKWIRSFKRLDEGSSQADFFAHQFENTPHWLITGGLGAIGLELAEQLAKQGDVKITLIGRREFVPQAQWVDTLTAGQLDATTKAKLEKLVQLQALGAQINIERATVDSVEEMKAAINNAVDKLGPIEAVLHCAGVPGAGALHTKTKAQLADVMAPKVQGTIVLSELLATQPLKFVGLMSSVTSYLGGFGQLEYCAANAFLDACSSSTLFSNAHQVLTMNWDPWSEVGMAYDAVVPSYKGNGAGLIGTLTSKTDHKYEFKAHLSATQTWALAEHKVAGYPTLPGAAYLEIAREGFSQISNKTVRFEDVYFLKPLSLGHEHWCELHTEMQVQTDGKWKFEISSRLNGIGNKVVHATGYISSINTLSEPTANIQIKPLVQRCNERVLADVTALQTTHKSLSAIETGPHWDVFETLHFGREEGLALLALNEEFSCELDEMGIHPAVLDCATAFMSTVINDAVYIPIFYQALEQYRPFTTRCYSHVRLASKSVNSDTLRFDVTIFDEDGALILKITGFEMRRLDDTGSEPTAPTVEEVDIEITGLLSQEGQESFIRSLGFAESNIVISKMQFNEEVARYQDMANLLDDSAGLTLQDRPELSSAYAAAKSSTEKKIVKIWSAILCMNKVGVNDDFFELGGDSLMLMQVHSQLNEMLPEQDLPIAELYNHTTIRALAESIDNGQQNESIEKEQVDQRVAKMKKARRTRLKNQNNLRKD